MNIFKKENGNTLMEKNYKLMQTLFDKIRLIFK